MTKQILMSIQPQHLCNILNGTKTLELRKTVPNGFVGWVNLYCTKGGKRLQKLYKGSLYYYYVASNFKPIYNPLNGKIVARFWWDGRHNSYGELIWDKVDKTYHNKDLKQYELIITNLEIFDKPKEVGEFEVLLGGEESFIQLTTLPTNWRYVWGRE